MALYDRLAPYYDAFFPQDPRATAFLLELAGRPGGAEATGRAPLAVDFGCATGSQVLDLARSGWRAVGWEPSEPMLEIARRKARALGLDASFEPLAMQDAGRIERGSAGLALCLGNTLPHLGSEEELGRFIADLASIAAPGGAVAIQLLNYELVLSRLRSGEFAFPVLSAAGASFERSYAMGSDGKLSFRVELVEEGRRWSSESALTPFSRGAIASFLESSGFADVRSRSGWGRDSFDPREDQYLILTARKGPAR